MANNIIQNTDKAYGYKYTSLAKLAQAGVDIPRMRTSVLEGKQFVEYLDDDGQWQRGAEVVVPDMKGMNAAQAYGSALTYARRYTVMMARSVACTDDQLLETQEPEEKPEVKPSDAQGDVRSVKKATEAQLDILRQRYKGDNLAKLLSINGVEALEDLPSKKASELISRLKNSEKRGEE